MTKKIIKVEDKKQSKSKLNINKITKTIIENGEAIEKITDGINEIVNGKSTKKSKKSKKNSSSISKMIDIAGTFLNK